MVPIYSIKRRQDATSFNYMLNILKPILIPSPFPLFNRNPSVPCEEQSGCPTVRVPWSSFPFLSTHQHSPEDVIHCIGSKLPSARHSGTKTSLRYLLVHPNALSRSIWHDESLAEGKKSNENRSVC